MKLLLLALVLTLSLSGDEHYEKHKHFYSKDLNFLALNKAQTDSIKHIIKKYRKQMKQFRIAKEGLEGKKRAIFIDDNFNEEKLQAINEEIDKNKSEIEIEFLKQIHPILDKSQREKFGNYLEEWEIE